MFIKAFQIVLIALVGFFTLIGLTIFLTAFESILLSGIGGGERSFTFALSRRFLSGAVLTVLLLCAVAVGWYQKRRRG
jgi:type III secretory pathway component EscU